MVEISRNASCCRARVRRSFVNLARRHGKRTYARATDWEYRWPIRFVWVAMAFIFCAAGISKLRHSGLDWIGSDNLSLLSLRQQYHLSDGEPLTNWGISVADHR